MGVGFKLGLWSKIKEWNRFNLRSALPGYVFNNNIFKLAIGLVFVWLVLAANSIGWETKPIVYIHPCPLGGMSCQNPFYYENYDKLGISRSECPDPILCGIKEFSPGQGYNKPAGFWYDFASLAVGLIMLLAIVANHLLYNRKYKFQNIIEEE